MDRIRLLLYISFFYNIIHFGDHITITFYHPAYLNCLWQ